MDANLNWLWLETWLVRHVFFLAIASEAEEVHFGGADQFGAEGSDRFRSHGVDGLLSRRAAEGWLHR